MAPGNDQVQKSNKPLSVLGVLLCIYLGCQIHCTSMTLCRQFQLFVLPPSISLPVSLSLSPFRERQVQNMCLSLLFKCITDCLPVVRSHTAMTYLINLNILFSPNERSTIKAQFLPCSVLNTTEATKSEIHHCLIVCACLSFPFFGFSTIPDNVQVCERLTNNHIQL